MIKFIDLLNEWNNGDRKIIAIFPGESKNNPYMYYYIDSETKMVFYQSSGTPVVVADNFDEFKKLVKNKRIRAELI